MLGTPLSAAQLIVTKIQRNPPKPGRELGLDLILLALVENAFESFLLQVLPPVRVSGHARAKPEDRLFPTLDELRESLVIVLRTNFPHRLLVAAAEQGGNHVSHWHRPFRL